MFLNDFVSFDLAPWQWAALFFSALCIGVSKTGINGVIVIMVPVLVYIFGAKESTGIVLPMVCFADLMAVVFYRRSAKWKYILRLLPWALAGFALALFVDRLVPADAFKVLIGICVLGGLIVMTINDLRKKMAQKNLVAEPAEPKTETAKSRVIRYTGYAVFGIAGGFSTMIGNAAGPVMSVFFLLARLPKTGFVGTAAWFFLIVNYLKIPIQIFAWHNITIPGLKLGLVLAPVIVAGTLLGLLLVKKSSESVYRILVYVMTVVSAALLFR